MIVDCSTNSNQSTVYLVNKLFIGAKTHFLPSITANLCLLLVPSIFSLSLLHRNITEIDRKQMTLRQQVTASLRYATSIQIIKNPPRTIIQTTKKDIENHSKHIVEMNLNKTLNCNK